MLWRWLNIKKTNTIAGIRTPKLLDMIAAIVEEFSKGRRMGDT